MTSEFSPENMIDREVEQEIFDRLLKLEDDARLLIISDKGGRGKTMLLKRLHYNCVYRHDLPVALVELQSLRDPSPFTLIEEFHRNLIDVSPNLRFPRFDELNDARKLKDAARLGARAGLIEGRVDARAAEVSGSSARFIGVQMNNPTIIGAPEWTPEMEDNARRKCLQAFFDDLKEICEETTVVLLLDTWDGGNSELKRWIELVLLRHHCFKRETRPARLVLVLTGRPEGFPNFKDQLADQYPKLVRSIESFGEWNLDHVRAFLKIHGYEKIEEEDLQRIRAGINKPGKSLLDVLQAVKLFFAD